MVNAVCKKCVIPLLLAPSLMYLVCYAVTKHNVVFHLSGIRDKLFPEWTSVATLNANVVLPDSYNYRNETFGCRTTRLIDMTFPICHYTPKDDRFVTGLLMNGKYYESNEVRRFLRLLRDNPRLQLVDIGANVGLFSLPAARVAQVLAVEPNWRSMARLAKAVDLGEVTSNITLVHNAISNVRTTVNMSVHPNNQGHAFLTNTAKCEPKRRKKVSCNNISPTKTILLNDILPLMQSKAALIKCDTQGHDVNIFTDSTAGEFFDNIDVPLIFMEWVLCKTHPASIVQRLIDFFHRRNYTAFTEGNSKLESHYLRWPTNILWKKPTYVRF